MLRDLDTCRLTIFPVNSIKLSGAYHNLDSLVYDLGLSHLNGFLDSGHTKNSSREASNDCDTSSFTSETLLANTEATVIRWFTGAFST